MPSPVKQARYCVGDIGVNEIIGFITVVMTLVMYSMYIRDIVTNKIKPHPFSWFLFLIITATIFIAQLSNGAGPGAWMNGVVTGFNFAIFTMSLKYKDSVIKKFDFFVLGLAIIAIVFWIVMRTPFYSVILLSIAVTLAFIPTLNKAYSKPYEESIYLFAVGFFRHGLTLFAMDNISIITILAPMVLVIDNIVVMSFIVWRRRQIKP